MELLPHENSTGFGERPARRAGSDAGVRRDESRAGHDPASPRQERPIATKEPANPDAAPLIDVVLTCLEDLKAVDVANIDLKGKSSIADNMVVATGTSSRQVASLAERLLHRLKDRGLVGLKPEGLRQGDWVLIDAGDVIVHLFRPEIREFYNIEKMWGVVPETGGRSSGTGG